MADKIKKTDQEWNEKLTPEQFTICRRGGTEPAFTGIYWDCKDEGVYRCSCCGGELFSSETKFDSGTGWPSFWEAIEADRVMLSEDHSHGMRRTEATCSRCDAHLGHVFDDGPRPNGKRFCINSASLDLQRKK